MGGDSLTFAEAIAAVEKALQFGINPSLEGITALCERLGRPQDALRFVQVTGTNGKTSVTRMTAALLGATGAAVACYTSPHLVSYTERIEIGGAPASENDFARALSAALDAAAAVGGDFTEFELLTAAALWLMRDLGVEWGVLEVGLGGRWDATTVVDPVVAVVTGVSLDHTDRLGTTEEAIAADKSHIIKRGATAVIGPGAARVAPILLERAARVGAAAVVRVMPEAGAGEPGAGVPGTGPDDAVRTVRYRIVTRPDRPGGDLVLDTAGIRADYRSLAVAAPSYQAPNVAVAVAAAEAALGRELDPTTTRAALASMRFPGRFEPVARDPWIVLDGGHNPEAASALVSAIGEAFPSAKPVAVIGMLVDKDAETFVRTLAPHVAGFICTRNSSYRSRTAADLAEVVREVTGVPPARYEDLAEAIRAATSDPAALGVVVTGSLYTVGEARSLIGGALL